MTNKPWNFLKPGDIVDIIAPSFTVPSDNLIDYYQKAKTSLANIGLIARIPDDLIQPGKDSFSANTIEYRVKHLTDALTNNESKAIWAIRGGYGAAKIIPFLEQMNEPAQPKLLLGFSDITALHLFMQNKWHWNVMHSAVINQIINNPKLADELKPIIFGQQKEITYNNLIPLNEQAKQSQNIESEITGGNLSLVQTSLATSWSINATDKIVFLEEVGEKGYQVDRMLNHLLQAGIFKQAKAVIFGEITPELEKDGSNLCLSAIKDFTMQLNIPVLSLPTIGHNTASNSPLPLGSICNLVLGDNPTLTCTSGGIAIGDDTC